MTVTRAQLLRRFEAARWAKSPARQAIAVVWPVIEELQRENDRLRGQLQPALDAALTQGDA